MKKYLLVGLGNIGAAYEATRHNIGFELLDLLSEKIQASFSSERLAYYGVGKYKGRELHLIKPTTYMNRSGLAVSYWQRKLKIRFEQLLVLTDDLSLPYGKIRLKPRGGSGGHNGLKSIITEVGSPNFPRLRFGIAANFMVGKQADYVLSPFSLEEEKERKGKMELAAQACLSFCFHGLEATMNSYNRSDSESR